jgi:site-specific DNA recombinase
LVSPALLGHVVTREPLLDENDKPLRDDKGKKLFGPETVVRNPDGSTLVRSDPILSREIFDRVCAELADRENRKEPTKRSTGLLLRVIQCQCGEPLYKLKGGKGRAERYRCRSQQDGKWCGTRSVKITEADGFVEALILGVLGPIDRPERVWERGTDNSAELADLNDELVDLSQQLGKGAFRAGTPQRAALDTRIAELSARQQLLEAEEVKPSGWSWQPTGELFADWWRRQDVTARNVWLRSMKVTLTVTDDGYGFRADDVAAMLEGVKGGPKRLQWLAAEDGRSLQFAADGDGLSVTKVDESGKTTTRKLL